MLWKKSALWWMVVVVIRVTGSVFSLDFTAVTEASQELTTVTEALQGMTTVAESSGRTTATDEAAQRMTTITEASPGMMNNAEKLAGAYIPRCCSREDDLRGNHTCRTHSQASIVQHFLPPVVKTVDSRPIILNNIIEDAVNLSCGNTQRLSNVSLIAPELPDTIVGWILNDHMILMNKNTPILIYLDSFCTFEIIVDYCVDMETLMELSNKDGEQVIQYIAKFCTEDFTVTKNACDNATCVRKCCKSKSPAVAWEPKFASGSIINHIVLVGKPDCSNLSEMKTFDLLDNGYISTEIGIFTPNQYCINDTEETVNVCIFEEKCDWVPKLQLFMTVVSCVCLVISLCLYIFYPQMRKPRLHSWCLMSMIASQLLAFLAIQLNTSFREEFASSAFCSAIAMGSLVAVLATFFWISVIGFNLWHTTWNAPDMRREKRWFMWYSVYGWGSPLLVGMLAVVMDTLKPSGAILPNFKDHNCWFEDSRSEWAYKHSIVLVILLLNLCIFVNVARKLYRLNAEAPSSANQNRFTQRLRVPLSLSVIMGLFWIGEISYEILPPCHYGLAVITVISGSQGLFILLVVVLSSRTRRLIRTASIFSSSGILGRSRRRIHGRRQANNPVSASGRAHNSCNPSEAPAGNAHTTRNEIETHEMTPTAHNATPTPLETTPL